MAVEFYQPADGTAALAALAGRTVPYRARPSGARIGTARVLGVLLDEDLLGATCQVDLDDGGGTVDAIRRGRPGFRLELRPGAGELTAWRVTPAPATPGIV